MAVIYDDDVAPATEPNAPPATRGRLVYDPPAAAPGKSILDTISEHNPLTHPLSAVRDSPVYGALDIAGTGALNLAGKVAAGYHGLGKLISGQGLDAAADAVNADRAALHTEADSPGAATVQNALGVVAKPFKAVAAPIDKAVANAGPAVSTAVPAASEAAQDITSILPLGAASRMAKAADTAAVVEGGAKPSTATPLETARAAGYKVPPSVAQASNPALDIPGTTREAIVGPSGIRADTNLEHQALTTKLAGKEIGLPTATKITADDAANFRKTGPGPKYDTVAQKIGFVAPDTTATDELGSLVADQNPATALPPKARTNVDRIANKINDGSYTGKDWIRDVSWLRENGARSAADTLEDMADRHLTAQGDNETLALHRGARTDFAKSYDIQNAIGRGGQIDAQQIRALDDKYPGLLTGNLKVIATAARELPEVTQLPGADTGPGVHTKLQAVHNAVGGVIKRLPGMNPMSQSFQDAKFGREMIPTEQSYVPSFGGQNQVPVTQRPTGLESPAPSGELTLAPGNGAGGAAQPRGEGIPLADVLSTGVEKPAPLGLSLSPMGAQAPQGVPFSRDAGQMAGDLQLADEPPRRLGEALSDVAGVRSQGVPEGITQRTAPDAKLRSKDSVPYTDSVIPLGQELTKGRKKPKGGTRGDK